MDFEITIPGIGTLGIEEMILILAVSTAMLFVVAVWAATLPRKESSRRARELVDRRAARKRQSMEAASAKRQRRSVQGIGFMRNVVSRFKLFSRMKASERQMVLARAGFRSNDAVIVFLFAKLVCPFAMAALGVFLFFGIRVYDASQPVLILFVAGFTVLGFFLPNIYVHNETQKRKEILHKALPDGIDLSVICAEAGLSLDASLNRVASELERSWPELGEEFGLAAVELGFVQDRREALDNLANRTGLPGMRALVNTLIQTERYGTPLADSLRVLAAELRHERLMKAEEKAAQLPATLMVPLILFILPPLFVVLIGPAALGLIAVFSSVN